MKAQTSMLDCWNTSNSKSPTACLVHSAQTITGIYVGQTMKAQISMLDCWNTSNSKSPTACLVHSPLFSSVMESPNPNPFAFFHHHFLRLSSHIATRIDETRREIARNLQAHKHFRSSLPFASLSQHQQHDNNLRGGKHVFDLALSSANVSKTLSGTELYTVSNSDNEFVLISDPNGLKSIGLLCFRQEDAEAFLAQVRLRKGELRGRAKVVPIALDQVYMLKVEGIAFRFLPDPVQLKNAMELKASATQSGFDGVPVFQSDLLVIKKKNKRYCPIYFRKEDIEKELLLVPRGPRGPAISQHIMVGSLEDVLKKMEMSEKNSGWEDLIFIPPGKSHSQYLQEVVNA